MTMKIRLPCSNLTGYMTFTATADVKMDEVCTEIGERSMQCALERVA